MQINGRTHGQSDRQADEWFGRKDGRTRQFYLLRPRRVYGLYDRHTERLTNILTDRQTKREMGKREGERWGREGERRGREEDGGGERE